MVSKKISLMNGKQLDMGFTEKITSGDILTESEMDTVLVSRGGLLSNGYLSQAAPMNSLTVQTPTAFFNELQSCLPVKLGVSGTISFFGLKALVELTHPTETPQPATPFTFYKTAKTGKITYSFQKNSTTYVFYDLKVSQ